MKNKGLLVGLMGLAGFIGFGSRNGSTTPQTTTTPATMPTFYNPDNLPAILPTQPDYYKTVTLGYSPSAGLITNRNLGLDLNIVSPDFDLSSNQYTLDPTGQTAAGDAVQAALIAANTAAGVDKTWGGYAVDQMLATNTDYQAALAAKANLDALETARMNAYRDLTPADYLVWRQFNLGY
jgi:hypothetical protein